MTVELTTEEREVLLGLVEREIADLGPEIRHTDNSNFRDGLKARRQALRDLLESLRTLQAA